MTPALAVSPPEGGPPAPGTRRLGTVVVSLFLLLCLALGIALKPTTLLSQRTGEPQLEQIIPKQFGDWVLSPYGAAAVVDPQLAEAVRNVYTSMLARSYIHKPSGREIMLSLAYGNDQSRDTQLHRPEMCYGGSGFRIEALTPVDLDVAGSRLQATRMIGTLGPRVEPVTYVVRYGDTNVRGSLQMNLVRMHYAADGLIADGMLFRVSEVTRRTPLESYRLQDRFIADLLSSMPPRARAELVGARAF